MDLHGFNKPLAHAAIRAGLQQHHKLWQRRQPPLAKATEEKQQQKNFAKKEKGEGKSEEVEGQDTSPSPPPSLPPPPQSSAQPALLPLLLLPDLVIITGKGLHSWASAYEPVLRPDVMRMLTEEFDPPIDSWTVPGNTGRLLVSGNAVEAWAKRTALHKAALMKRLSGLLAARFANSLTTSKKNL
mmetsp:Transcript_28216/g.47750  ORF Transcript_28216/g.47750 Transcript_28216/m.47750 type:complete len:185 (-) Transcript_28216:328-882(-)